MTSKGIFSQVGVGQVEWGGEGRGGGSGEKGWGTERL